MLLKKIGPHTMISVSNIWRPGMIEIQCHPRVNKLITLAKRVVVRKKVRLAFVETNNIELVTRSVTNHYMREHSLTTVVLAISRALELTFGKAVITYLSE